MSDSVSAERQTIRDQAVKKALNYLLADELAGTAGAMRSRMIAERLAIKTQNGTLGKPTREPQDAELEDMQIRVGDDTHYYPAQQGRQPSGILPWVLAAALGAGGIGAAAGTYLNRPDTTEIEQATKAAAEMPEYSLKISSPNAQNSGN